MLWSVGSAKPIEVVSYSGDSITLKGEFSWRPYGNPQWYKISEPVQGRLNENGELMLIVTHQLGEEQETFNILGKKMPPLPDRPDLSGLKFGEPIDLLADGLAGWKLTNSDKVNGWRFEEGTLINETPKTDFGAYGNYGNLRTLQVFEDFELSIEYNAPAGGNSGIYLRGAYEVQVVDRDSKMQGIQGPGAIFGRIEPVTNNGNPGGEWNKARILLVDRHVSVELNGQVVIDNQPLEGCTGGGINADDTKPGPIFLQGDHTSVKYRNIVLREVL